MPRFGHGTFLHCLESIYKKLSGRELKYTAIIGKPSEITYCYAEKMIQKHAESIGITNGIKRLYAIGDNIDTDIFGANRYNKVLNIKKAYTNMNSNKFLVHNETFSNKIFPPKTIYSENNSKNNQKLALGSISNIYDLFISQTESFSSILVKTGVFNGDINEIIKNNDEVNLAHKDTIIEAALKVPNFITQDAYEAVKLIFELENF